MNKSEDKKNLQDLVSDFDVAMLVTYSGTAVHARPMVIALTLPLKNVPLNYR